MLNLKRGLSALTFALWLGGTQLHAQTGGTGGGATGGGGTGGTGGAGGLSGGGGAGGGTGGGGTGGTGGQGGGGTGGQGGTGARAGAGASGSAGGSGSDATNFLSTTYSNPLFMGRPNQVLNFGANSGADAASLSGGTTTNNQPPGGFGQPSFGTSTSATARTGGTATTSSGLGRTGGAGGLVSFTPSTQASASRIAYTASLKFPVRSLPPSTLQSDLRDMLDRSSTIKNAGKIVVLVDPERNVVIKGKVADDDERRLIMGMLRLTPGVREIQNELVVE